MTSVRLVAAGIVFGCGEEPKSPDKGQTTIAFSCTERKICHEKERCGVLDVTDDLDRALAKLARAHVNQNEADYARFMVVFKDGEPFDCFMSTTPTPHCKEHMAGPPVPCSKETGGP